MGLLPIFLCFVLDYSNIIDVNVISVFEKCLKSGKGKPFSHIYREK